MKLRNVMTTEVHVVSTGATVEEAAKIMEIFNLSFLPVLAHGRPEGVITANDVVHRVIAKGLSPSKTRVGDVMSIEPIAISEEEGIEEAAVAMRKHGVSHLLVLRDDGTMGGVFTLSDLAMLWALSDSGEVLRRIAEPRMLHSRRGNFRSGVSQSAAHLA